MTILPGTNVKFDGGFYLAVNKDFTAAGNATDSIYFKNGYIQLRWPGLNRLTYNSDGTYVTYEEGPRFEYCSLGSGIIEVANDINGTLYNNGCYIKNSTINIIRSNGSSKNMVGTYIDSTICGHMKFSFYACRLTNSYIDTLVWNPYHGTSSVSHCEIGLFQLVVGVTYPLENIQYNNIGYLHMARLSEFTGTFYTLMIFSLLVMVSYVPGVAVQSLKID